MAYLGVLAAAMVALGFALAPVPHVELVSLTAFLAGWLLGPLKGAVAGGLGAFLFSLFNPYGPPLPPVWLAQVVGMALVAVGGGTMRLLAPLGGRAGSGRRPGGRARPWASVSLALAGGLLTLIYDLLTDAGHAAAMGLASQMGKVMLAGVSFALVHIASNALIFGFLGPLALGLVERRGLAPYRTGPRHEAEP